jgi:hypothetical protein
VLFFFLPRLAAAFLGEGGERLRKVPPAVVMRVLRSSLEGEGAWKLPCR